MFGQELMHQVFMAGDQDIICNKTGVYLQPIQPID
jgi:hypothetical protein